MPTDEPLDAFEVFAASRLRARIIRTALTHGAVTAADLMRELGVPRSTLERHLRTLVAADILKQSTVVDPTREVRQGGMNALEWRINATALRRWSSELLREITAAD